MTTPTFHQLKKALLDSGFEIRTFPRRTLERLALDAPADVKRHVDSNIMGLIMPDDYIIGLAKELSPQESTSTLIHEVIHLWNETLDEETVEAFTLELEAKLTPAQIGFFQFLAH